MNTESAKILSHLEKMVGEEKHDPSDTMFLQKIYRTKSLVLFVLRRSSVFLYKLPTVAVSIDKC